MGKLPDPKFTALYFAVMILVITAEWAGWEMVYLFTKPAMVLMLFFYFLKVTKNTTDKVFRNLILAALLFCVAGDTLLMFVNENESYFLAGLAVFFVAHLLYTAAFTFDILKNRPWKQHWRQLAFSTVLVVFGAEFFILNRTSFGELWVPVLLYCIAITIMGVAATMRDASANGKGYFYVVIGAVLFIASDSLLATNKFIIPFALAGPSVLLTYFVAQYYIAAGCIAKLNNKIL